MYMYMYNTCIKGLLVCHIFVVSTFFVNTALFQSVWSPELLFVKAIFTNSTVFCPTAIAPTTSLLLWPFTCSGCTVYFISGKIKLWVWPIWWSKEFHDRSRMGWGVCVLFLLWTIIRYVYVYTTTCVYVSCSCNLISCWARFIPCSHNNVWYT